MLQLVSAGVLLASALTVDKTIPDDTGRDPLAPAQAGMVQCFDPDTANHSCRLIAAYRPARDGSWVKVATIMPDPTQHMTVDIETPVAVRDGAVCGIYSRDQVLGAKLRYFDRQVPADHAIPLLGQIADAMSSAFDREFCTRFIAGGGVLIARSRFTGDPTVLPDQRVIWVRADAGFRVQPRGGSGG